MTRLLVYVEGWTEREFVNEVLRPHLIEHGFASVAARLLGNAEQNDRRGGITGWPVARKEILHYLKKDTGAISATLVDYYGLPHSWPGRANPSATSGLRARAEAVRSAIDEEINEKLGYPRRFFPFVVMHEFEGLLFSDPGQLAKSLGVPKLASKFKRIRSRFKTPEHINDSESTAPSKRIASIHQGYQKATDGIMAIQRIGLGAVRSECPLFDEWLGELESYKPATRRRR